MYLKIKIAWQTYRYLILWKLFTHQIKVQPFTVIPHLPLPTLMIIILKFITNTFTNQLVLSQCMLMVIFNMKNLMETKINGIMTNIKRKRY